MVSATRVIYGRKSVRPMWSVPFLSDSGHLVHKVEGERYVMRCGRTASIDACCANRGRHKRPMCEVCERTYELQRAAG